MTPPAIAPAFERLLEREGGACGGADCPAGGEDDEGCKDGMLSVAGPGVRVGMGEGIVGVGLAGISAGAVGVGAAVGFSVPPLLLDELGGGLGWFVIGLDVSVVEGEGDVGVGGDIELWGREDDTLMVRTNPSVLVGVRGEGKVRDPSIVIVVGIGVFVTMRVCDVHVANAES